MRIEIEREDDGRWLGEVPALPGVFAYGATAEEARARAEALALRVIADGTAASSSRFAAGAKRRAARPGPIP